MCEISMPQRKIKEEARKRTKRSEHCSNFLCGDDSVSISIEKSESVLKILICVRVNMENTRHKGRNDQSRSRVMFAGVILDHMEWEKDIIF
jgi:hypothetical protein